MNAHDLVCHLVDSLEWSPSKPGPGGYSSMTHQQMIDQARIPLRTRKRVLGAAARMNARALKRQAARRAATEAPGGQSS